MALAGSGCPVRGSVFMLFVFRWRLAGVDCCCSLKSCRDRRAGSGRRGVAPDGLNSAQDTGRGAPLDAPRASGLGDRD